MIAPSTLKVCRRCGEERPFDAFGPDRRNTDGRRSYCRECRRRRAREKRRVARGVTGTARNTSRVTPRGVAGNLALSGARKRDDRDRGDPAGPWPQPLHPATTSPALVARRLRVIAIYEVLDARPPNPGVASSPAWRRKVYGDGREGGP